jgi:hypothetical protein
VEAAVLGAVAPALPAGGTAGKEAQAPGAAAAYAAKGLYDQRHPLVALIVTRVVVVAPVEGDVALACLVVKGGEAPGGRGPGRRQAAAGAAAKQVRILYVGRPHTAQGTRVRHRRAARLEAASRQRAGGSKCTYEAARPSGHARL